MTESKETPPAAAETKAVVEKKAAPPKKEPTEAQAAYEKLVHINTTGWEAKRIVAHRKKCTEALAAKQGK